MFNRQHPTDHLLPLHQVKEIINAKFNEAIEHYKARMAQPFFQRHYNRLYTHFGTHSYNNTLKFIDEMANENITSTSALLDLINKPAYKNDHGLTPILQAVTIQACRIHDEHIQTLKDDLFKLERETLDVMLKGSYASYREDMPTYVCSLITAPDYGRSLISTLNARCATCMKPL